MKDDLRLLMDISGRSEATCQRLIETCLKHVGLADFRQAMIDARVRRVADVLTWVGRRFGVHRESYKHEAAKLVLAGWGARRCRWCSSRE